MSIIEHREVFEWNIYLKKDNEFYISYASLLPLNKQSLYDDRYCSVGDTPDEAIENIFEHRISKLVWNIEEQKNQWVMFNKISGEEIIFPFTDFNYCEVTRKVKELCNARNLY